MDEAAAPAGAATPAHLARLGALWRSAGWPCHDNLELDLLAAGLVERVFGAGGHETLRVTAAGIERLAARRRRQQGALSRHEQLVQRVALEMQRQGRLVWRGLSLRAPIGEPARWVQAMPDVFSIRRTTREECTEPVVHEIKVSRADLLSDLRKPDKGAAYRALAGRCWYVLREGIAEPDEVPAEYGVVLARAEGLEVARAAPARPLSLPFMAWMALAQADCEPAPDGGEQACLGEPDTPEPPR